MNTPIVLSRDDVTRLLDWTSVLEATREGLLVAGDPPAASSVSAQVMYPSGSLHLKSASLHDRNILSVKSNLRPTRGGVSGVLLAYDLQTEKLAGIIDAGLMTAWRTGAIAAVAAQHLLGRRAVRVAVLGVGPVGRQCAAGLLEVLNITDVRFWSHRPERSLAVASEFGGYIRASAHRDVADAVREADVIVTATPAAEPILTEGPLQSGVIILAMGADTVGKQELATSLLDHAVVIADVPDDARKVGESAHLAVNRQGLVTPLAQWLSSKSSPEHADIPLVFDSVGSSHVDAAVTAVIMARAHAEGRGRPLPW